VFHTDLALIPQDGLGLFFSTNTDKGGELSFGPFLEAFLDHYYPDPPAPVKPPADFAAQAGRFAGTYAANRTSYTTFQKVFGLAGAVPVSVGDSGNLVIKAPGGVMRLVQVDTMLFRDVVGQELVAFRADRSGRITHAFLADEPMVALERHAWYQTPSLHVVVLGLGLVLFLGTVSAAPFRLLRRRVHLAPPPRAVRVGRRFLYWIALANLVFVVWMAVLASDFWALLTGPMTALKLALALPVLGAVLTLGAAGSAVIQWKNGVGTVGGRLRYTTAVVITLLFVWSLNYWNLLGWRM